MLCDDHFAFVVCVGPLSLAHVVTSSLVSWPISQSPDVSEITAVISSCDLAPVVLHEVGCSNDDARG